MTNLPTEDGRAGPAALEVTITDDQAREIVIGVDAIAWHIEQWLDRTVERDWPDVTEIPRHAQILSLDVDATYAQLQHWIKKLHEFSAILQGTEGPGSPNPTEERGGE